MPERPNNELIERLYDGLRRGDGEAMAACYAPEARFSDPAFGELRDGEPAAMWRMLCSRSGGVDVELVEREADAESGSAHWIARYEFQQTGRPVVNDIRARFRFANGLIVEHDDEFDLHRWARQALGLPGLLLGWLPPAQAAFRRRARASLQEFIAEQPG